MTSKKEIDHKRKMNTTRMSSSKKKKETPSVDGSKPIPPAKNGRSEDVKKHTFASTKKLKKK